MSMMLSAEELAQYFEGKKKSPVYDKAKSMYDAIKVHANGEEPSSLIDRRRPNESEEVNTYRKEIFVPVTKQTFSRVLQSLGKIRRSRDWAIKYNNDKKHSMVPEAETMNEYCEKNFPYYTSVTNWLFSVALKSVLVDANCALLILPLNPTAPQTDFSKPYPVIYYSDQIIEYLEGRYAILKASDQVEVQTKDGVKMSDKFYLVTTNEVVPYVKNGDNWTALTDEVITHALGYLPIIRPRCQFFKTIQEYNLFESRISSMIPSLDEAVREYSDLQAAVVSHLFPERWEIATQECNSCAGGGFIPNPSYTGTDVKSKQLVCPDCHGLGAKAASSPYKKTVIRLPKVNTTGEQPMPMPPFDYVKKDIDVIKIMEERIERHIFRGLASINMQFLDQTPLSISGEAKQVDRDELNNFVYNIAEDIVYIADLLYGIIADYRYKTLYPSLSDRRAMLPFIPVPEQFELLGADAIMDTIGKMKNNNIGGSMLTAMLIKYAKMQFWQESDIANALMLELMLDRYSGMSEADILASVTAGKISDVDYWIHLNIKDYVKRAIDGDYPDFIQLDYDQQYMAMTEYAKEEIAKQKESLIPSPPPVRPGAPGTDPPEPVDPPAAT